MKDENKKTQLIKELTNLRQRIKDSDELEAECTRTKGHNHELF